MFLQVLLLLAQAFVFAAPLQRAELDQDWLDGTADLTRERFVRLISIADQDPVGAVQVDEAVRMLRLQSRSDLFPYFRPCTGVDASLSGRTRFRTEIDFKWLTVDEMLGRKKFQYRADEDYVELITRVSKDYAITFKFKRYPTNLWICLKTGTNLTFAYGTMIHELNHLTRKDFSKALDVLAYKSSADFVIGDMVARGDEVDSFIAGYSAMIRLTELSGLRPNEVQSYFDSRGAFLGDHAGFASFLLDFGGYRSVKEQAYGDDLDYRAIFAEMMIGAIPRGIERRKEFLRAVSAKDRHAILAAWRSIERLTAESRNFKRDVARIRELKKKLNRI